jgi:hypothetical protein
VIRIDGYMVHIPCTSEARRRRIEGGAISKPAPNGAEAIGSSEADTPELPR